MASSGRNYDHNSRSQRLRRDPMRTGYVLVSEERESGSEYSGSTCCCSSCASSCSSSKSSDEDDDDDDDAYLSDCSACWARRDALRRGRAGWREGGEDGDYVGGERRAEERDRARQDYRHHNHRHGQHRHGETRQRGGQQSNGNSSRNNNGSPNINTNNTTATPAYRNLTERILATTRRLHQEEENRRHFRSWMRVLEDVQRRSHTSYRSNSNSNSNAAPATAAAAAAAAVAVGQGSSSSAAAAVGRVPPRAGAGEEAPPMRRRTTHVYSYPPRAAVRGYFMSGGRSISSNRRRRL
ncbi:hypothetical protein CFAM422_004638 [Trichoderma lentiforme]|uniref:Uncharacterized protein n=1 Tax=Trichoderma lentiforme TaxID=1567552 RepID=A0A9P5CG77_9HYPO|nr:hypothetical protein CFAM422_004638 [Trichoderma lentiforme]